MHIAELPGSGQAEAGALGAGHKQELHSPACYFGALHQARWLPVRPVLSWCNAKPALDDCMVAIIAVHQACLLCTAQLISCHAHLSCDNASFSCYIAMQAACTCFYPAL